MARDVASIVQEYESTPAQEPMHGRPGETRRNPSTDDKRIRREQMRSHAELEPPPMSVTAAIATLLGQASTVDTDEERRSLLSQVEALRTRQAEQQEAEFGWDPRLAVMHPGPVPGAVYERNTADSDWLLGIEATSDLRQVGNEMIVQASRWFERVPEEVKAYGGEFSEQARNMARRLAGRYGEHADYADETFRTEATRLRTVAVRAGLVKNAIDELVEDTFGKMKDGSDVDGLAEASRGVTDGLYNHTGSLRATGGLDINTALWEAIDEPIQAEAASEYKDEVLGTCKNCGQQVYRDTYSYNPEGKTIATTGEEGGSTCPSTGGDHQVVTPKQAASGVPQVGEQGLPQAEFANLAGESTLPPGATDSNRSPVLQEMQNYDGWSGTSVVPPDDGHAETANAGDIGPQDAARPQPGFPVGASKTAASGIPKVPQGSYIVVHHQPGWKSAQLVRGDGTVLGGSNIDVDVDHYIAEVQRKNPHVTAIRHEYYGDQSSKESSMPQAHAQCPTCGGQGKVAVRVLDPRQAYSGLPQIDQIMNNSDTASEQTEYPAQVAFPITWDGNAVPSAISETEQQIAQRNQRSQLAPQAAQQHRANGRDNSGWAGDIGARGTDYPGYSTPNYGGPDNLGQPDPVYDQGGDNPNRPLLPYGNAETSDVTNEPDQWAYGQPAQNDQAWRTVAPGGGMNVQGGLSQQDKIAAVQARIARDQQLLAAVYEGRA